MNDDDDWPHDDDDYGDGLEPDCLICCGEGFQWGYELGDPLWYDEYAVYPCTSCGGSGLAKDMTYC